MAKKSGGPQADQPILFRRDAASPFSNDPEQAFLLSFVARERETLALDEAFARGASHVCLVGPAGMGKTTLARFYERRAAGQFPGGLFHADASWAESVPHLWDRVIGARLQPDQPALLVVDDAEAFDEAAIAELRKAVANVPQMRVLLTSRTRIAAWPDLTVIPIGGFTQAEFDHMLRLRNDIVHGAVPSDEIRRRLYALAQGNPAFARMAADAVSSRKRDCTRGPSAATPHPPRGQRHGRVEQGPHRPKDPAWRRPRRLYECLVPG